MKGAVGALLAVAGVAAAGIAGSSAERDAGKAPPLRCDRFAAVRGHDAWKGTRRRPVRTVQRLVNGLGSGDVGCLDGVFVGNVAVERGGAPGRPITITSTDSKRATVRGRIYVPDSANDVVFTRLILDGRNPGREVSIQIFGDRVSLLRDDISNHHEGQSCVLLGSPVYGIAYGTTIAHSRIHDCGWLPPTRHDHGIYVQSARGARISRNVIVGNAGWGIHLYPDSDGSVVVRNTVAANGGGIIFAGDEEHTSSGNVVRSNIVTGSAGGPNVESSWAGMPGTGNEALRNCLWRGKGRNVGPQSGFVSRRNVAADPHYLAPARGDFRLAPGSPCARMGAYSKR
jgi:parallel beta-helix repeat protein